MRILAIIALALMLGCPPPIPEDSGDPLGVIITPAEPVVPVGEETQLVAYAFYEDGSWADVTYTVQWGVLSGYALAVSNELDHHGVAFGIESGTAEVVAAFGNVVSAPIVVRVTDADVVGLSITPNDLALYDGDSAWLTATADFSDGTRGDFSGGVRWITGDPDVVTIAADGRVTGMGEGATQARAEYEGVAAEPVEIDVYPSEGAESDDPFTDNDDPFGGDDDDATETTGDDDDDDTGDDDDDTETGEEETAEEDGLPDLEITYFSAYVGDDVTYYFIDVTNNGPAAAEGFYVDLFVDPWWGTPEVGEDGDDWTYISGLEPGETGYADFEVDDTPWWLDWDSYAIIDTTREVWESDEDNNVDGPLDVG